MNEQIKKCIEKICSFNYDAFLVSSSDNVTYLTNFRQADGYLLITKDEEIFYFTNFLYQQEATKIKCWKLVISNGKNIFDCIAETIKENNLKKIAFESKNLPFLEYKKLSTLLKSTNAKLLSTVDFVEQMRAIKTKDEIYNIKKAISITEQAFEFIAEVYQNSFSEKDLAIEVEKFLKLKADNCLAFNPIVAYDKNSSYPHHLPKNHTKAKKIFLVDLGAKFNGYCADLTRVFIKGKISNLYRKILDIVREAQELAIKKIKPGAIINQIDKIARDFIDKKGFARYFGHGLGHGIGRSVHELPYINPYNSSRLEEGMVITIEPAIYLEEKFGIRLEEVVLVKASGAEILSDQKNIYYLS